MSGRLKNNRRALGAGLWQERAATTPIDVTIQIATARRGLPHAQQLRRWSAAAAPPDACGLTIRIVGSGESRKLNHRWRGKDYSTNVLSFPSGLTRAQSPEPTRRFLGDLVICAPVVAREAKEQGKPVNAHWAHVVVHGILHLQGYDHVKNRDAKRMEAREVEILARFGYQDPYVFQQGGDQSPI